MGTFWGGERVNKFKFNITEKKARNFKGVFIPAELWLAEDLSFIEKGLITEIDSLDNDNKKGCYASDKYFAGFLGKSESSVTKLIAGLKKKGIVKRVYYDGRTRGLRIVKTYYSGQEKLTIENSKNLLHNNKRDNKNKVILSKDSKNFSSSNGHLTTFTKEMISNWNLLKENYPHIKKTDVKKKTNTNQNIQRYLKELKAGTFLRGKEFSKQLKEFNNLPTKMKPLTTKEIIKGIKTMMLFLKEGYPPESKKSVGSLESMFYSKHFQSSYFLQALYNPPRPIQVIKDPDNKVSLHIIQFLDKQKVFQPEDEVTVFKAIKSIQEFVEKIPERTKKRFKSETRLLGLVKKYIQNSEHNDFWINTLSPAHFNIKHKLWKNFIRDLEDEWGGFSLTDASKMTKVTYIDETKPEDLIVETDEYGRDV